ncbi:MAG: stage IV sporulation protein A [Clostridia bacterium]|nr:stage IV sporulation protein A [Clostridia bacterium]
MDQKNLYQDIAVRCGGDIYLGVVGPVRTGKSTFIKRFMEELVLPNMDGEHRIARVMDELPVSGTGKTIMTTQIRFVPDEAVEVKLKDEASFRVRLVDCVGYLVPGALGLDENGQPRMVRTPWFEHDIPLEDAARIGTQKVIQEHASVGVMVTTDGSITELPRSAYVEAEEKAIKELKTLEKPFVVVLNSRNADSAETESLRASLAEKYSVPVIALDVDQMQLADLNRLLETLLFEFPLDEVHLTLPGWLMALSPEHWLMTDVVGRLREAAEQMHVVRDHSRLMQALLGSENVEAADVAAIHLNDGSIDYRVTLPEQLFYQVLSQESGQEIENEEHLFQLMTELTQAKKQYDRVKEALDSVQRTGYGMVPPLQSEMTLEEPVIVRQGSRFGVKLKANAPSLHLLRVDIATEVSPIVGTEKQSEELVQYLLSGFENDRAGIWQTEIFGKSLNDLVREGMASKLTRLPEDVQQNLASALSKIVNEGSGGMICILL